jgi:glutamate synthase domain-containing protein 3
MTGGRVVILGETGRNFAAGMSGGIAYIYDPNGNFPDKCNLGMVGLETVEENDEKQLLKEYIEEHASGTSSPLALSILNEWAINIEKFVKVMPHDYKKVLSETAVSEKN